MVSRRELLKFGSLTAAWILTTRGSHAQGQSLRTRPSIGNLPSNSPILRSYAAAVQRMKQLPPSDRRSWAAQANTHRDFCPHGNWYFLPWHRAYIHAFEDVIREMSQDADFVLPYWDWSQSPTLPQAFRTREVNGVANPLFDETRFDTVNAGQPLGPPFTTPAAFDAQVISDILTIADFELFGSSKPLGQNSLDAARWQRAQGTSANLEQGPHGLIHVCTGGRMSRVATGAQDPIFWLHHCNIDRIWARWNSLGRANTNDELWQSFEFKREFVSPQGQTRPYRIRDLNTTSDLGYRYDDIPVDTDLIVSNTLSGSTSLPIDLRRIASFAARPSSPVVTNQVSTAEVQISEPFAQLFATTRNPRILSNIRGETLPASGTGPRTTARIKNLKIQGAGNLTIRIFLNCDYLTPATPLDDPRFVASLSLFGLRSEDMDHGAGGHDAGTTISIDLTPTLDNLRRIGEPVTTNLRVQFLGAGPQTGASDSVTYDEVEIVVA